MEMGFYLMETENHFEALDFEQENNSIDLNYIKKKNASSCVGELITGGVLAEAQ